MATRNATARTRPAARTKGRSRARAGCRSLRRRLTLAAGLALVIVAVLSLVQPADHAVKEITLPLRHDDIIRQQAADKNVDASLIAAVIYTESRFRDQTSHAGAKGLMQLMPRDRGLHRAQVRRHALRARRPRDAADQHRLRHLVPALPAGQVQGQHDPHARGLQRRARARSTSGARTPPRAARSSASPSHIPFTGDARLRRTACSSARARLPQELPARTRVCT